MAREHQNERPTVAFTTTAQRLMCEKNKQKVEQLVLESGLGDDTKVTIRTKTEGAGVAAKRRFTVEVVGCNPKRHNRIPLLVDAIGTAIGQKTMQYTATTGGSLTSGHKPRR